MSATNLVTFNDGSGRLKTKEWLVAVGNMYRGEKVVDPYRIYDGVRCTGVVAPGQGRYGNDAFKMTIYHSGSLPDFYLIPYDKLNPNPGVAYSTPAWADGYILPRGKRANRLHIWFKYPSGFRAASSAIPNAQVNYHIGTYHRDPGSVAADGSNITVESNGWHFYHQIMVRHDLAQDQWVHICVNQRPTHKRDLSLPAVNPTRAYGNYWETATRIYFAAHPYGPSGNDPQNGDAQIPGPYDVLVDSIYMDYVEEYQPINIQIENWQEGQFVDVVPGTGTPTWNVTLTNTTSNTVSGRLDIETWGVNHMTRALLIDGTSTSAIDTDVTFTPNQTKIYQMTLTPTDTGFRNLRTDWGLQLFNASGGTYLISGVSSAGNFYQTAPINWNATAAEVEAALDAIPEGLGFIVTGSSYPYLISRVGGIGSRTWTFKVDSSSLLGTGAKACLNYSDTCPVSVTFYPYSEEVGRYGTQIISKNSPYVCYESTFKGYNGPPDGDICSKMFELRFWDVVPPAWKPICTDTSNTWRCSTNSNLSRQLSIFDVSGLPMTVTLIDYEANAAGSLTYTVSGGGALSISSGGLVNYTPTTNFKGIVGFRYKVNNGIVDGAICKNWIMVSDTPRAAQAAGKLYTSGGRLVTYT